MLKVMAKRPIFSEITNLDNRDKGKGKSINTKHSSLFTCCTCLKCLPVKSPKVGLFKASENKELVSPFGKKCIVLSEVFSSLGFPLDAVSMKDKECCMPCARSLITVSLKMSKLTKNLQKTTAPPDQPRQLSSPGQKRIRSQISSGLSPFKKAVRSEVSTESIHLVSECRQLAFSNGSGNKSRSGPASKSDNNVGQVHDSTSQSVSGSMFVPVVTEPTATGMEQGLEVDLAHYLFAGSPMDEADTAQSSDPVQAEEKQMAVEVKVSDKEELDKAPQQKRDKKSSVVQLSITYPKGRVKAVTPTGQFATLLRSVAYNQPKTFANSAMQIPEIRTALTNAFSDALTDEVKDYYKSENSLKVAKDTKPSEISDFKLSKLYNEIQEKMPLTLEFFKSMTGVTARERQLKKKGETNQSTVVTSKKTSFQSSAQHIKKDQISKNAICNAVSIYLKQAHEDLSKLHYRNTLMLVNGGCRSLDIGRMNGQGSLVSHKSAIRMQKKMASEFDTEVNSWKKEIEQKELMLLLLADIFSLLRSKEGEFVLSMSDIKLCKNFSQEVWEDCLEFIKKKQPNWSDNILHHVTSTSVMQLFKTLQETISDFCIVEDNVDLMVIARHQTLSYHNNSYHCAFHFGVKSRLSRDPSLEYEKPQSRIRDMDMVKLLPGKTTIDVLRNSFPHLVARIITKFISAYSTFKSSVTYHIVHKNSKQMAEKSHQCILGLIFKNPAKSNDMAEILKTFQERYVPRNGEVILKPIQMHGDAASEERGRNVQWTYRLEGTPYQQLKGLNLTFAEFHMLMCLYEVNNKIFLKQESAAQIGTSYASMTRTSSSNAKQGPKRNYNAFKDFHMSESEAHILASWMEFVGIKSFDGQPTTRPIPAAIALQPKHVKKNWFYNEIEQFLKKIVFDNASTSYLEELQDKINELQEYEIMGFPCRFPGCDKRYKFHSGRVNHERNAHDNAMIQDLEEGEYNSEVDRFGYYKCRLRCGHTYRSKQARNRHEKTVHPNEEIPSSAVSSGDKPKEKPKEDFKFNYHIARLKFGLLDLHIRDAIKEGDGQRLFLTLPFLLLFFHVFKRTKYSYVILLHLVKAIAVLPSGKANELLCERFFNRKGGAGNNIPMDLRMEHMVRLLKCALKQLGANISENGAQRIAQSLGHIENLLENASSDCCVKKPSGHHSSKPLQETVMQIVKDLISEESFKEIPGREHQSFKKFHSDILNTLNSPKYFIWINRLLKLWQAIYE